jgi:hypothetical protein
MSATTTTAAVAAPRIYQVVVVDGNPTHDWVKLFDGCTMRDGSPIRVCDIDQSINQCLTMQSPLFAYCVAQ